MLISSRRIFNPSNDHICWSAFSGSLTTTVEGLIAKSPSSVEDSATMAESWVLAALVGPSLNPSASDPSAPAASLPSLRMAEGDPSARPSEAARPSEPGSGSDRFRRLPPSLGILGEGLDGKSACALAARPSRRRGVLFPGLRANLPDALHVGDLRLAPPRSPAHLSAAWYRVFLHAPRESVKGDVSGTAVPFLSFPQLLRWVCDHVKLLIERCFAHHRQKQGATPATTFALSELYMGRP